MNAIDRDTQLMMRLRLQGAGELPAYARIPPQNEKDAALLWWFVAKRLKRVKVDRFMAVEYVFITNFDNVVLAVYTPQYAGKVLSSIHYYEDWNSMHGIELWAAWLPGDNLVGMVDPLLNDSLHPVAYNFTTIKKFYTDRDLTPHKPSSDRVNDKHGRGTFTDVGRVQDKLRALVKLQLGEWNTPTPVVIVQ